MKDGVDHRRTLDSLLQDVRQAPLESIDWARAEQQLLEKLEAQPSKRAPHSGPVALCAAAMVAAVVAAFLFSLRSDVERPSASRASEPSAADAELTTSAGGELQVGQRLVASDGPLELRHPGVATWTLWPDSSGEIESLEPSLVVELQSGFVRAEVVPSLVPESFAIEVGRLRVAVRGTVFSVRRVGRHAEVEVFEGRVVVGVTDGDATSLLQGPAFARFVATGKRAGEVVAKRGGVRSLTGTRRAPASSQASPSGSSAALVQQEPTFEDVERAVSEVESVLTNCLKQESGETPNSVRLSLKTRVAFKVEASGATRNYRFAPPLSPALHECAHPGLAGVRFAESQLGVHVIRDLDIKP